MLRLPFSSARLSFIALLLLAIASGISPRASAQDVLDGIAALVNDSVITFRQVRDLVGPKERSIRESLRGEAMIEKIKEVRLQAVNELIERELILQEFKNNKFTLPDYVVEERIQTIIREEFGGDRQAFMRTLSAQGYTLERFRKEEMEKYIVQAMRNQNVKTAASVPDAKIQEYYRENIEEYSSEEELKLRMLVLKSGGENENRRKLMEEIRAKIVSGAAFEDLARMYSEDSTQEAGGDWGWINRRTLNESLSKIAFTLKPGEVSRIVEMAGNYYLLYCEARKPQTVKPLKEVREEIEKRLAQAERQKAQQEWIAKLRKKAFVKVY